MRTGSECLLPFEGEVALVVVDRHHEGGLDFFVRRREAVGDGGAFECLALYRWNRVRAGDRGVKVALGQDVAFDRPLDSRGNYGGRAGARWGPFTTARRLFLRGGLRPFKVPDGRGVIRPSAGSEVDHRHAVARAGKIQREATRGQLPYE